MFDYRKKYILILNAEFKKKKRLKIAHVFAFK